MKVADVMSREVDYVTVNTTIKDVARIIFGRGINGLPVVDGQKLVGFITERDIIAQLFPSIQEFIEDPIHASDFESMEKKTSEVLGLPAEKIMSRNLHTVTEETPLLKAQSTMFIHKIGRLPVVDSQDRLIGIVSKGDIFEAVVQQKLPLHEEEGFYDWLARYYDSIIDWKKRLIPEITDLTTLFRREKVKKILDIASGTGEHAIALSKKGFEVFGIEASGIMSDIAKSKWEKLPKSTQEHVTFLRGKYKEVTKSLSSDFDAVIFMGNALPHVLVSDKNIISNVKQVMNPKKSIFIFQIANLQRFYQEQGGLREFVQKYNPKRTQGTLSLSFYNNKKGNTIRYNRMIFDFQKGKWIYRTANSIPTVYVDKTKTNSILRKAGFRHIEFYGSEMYGPLFKFPFNEERSYWLNILARR